MIILYSKASRNVMAGIGVLPFRVTMPCRSAQLRSTPVAGSTSSCGSKVPGASFSLHPASESSGSSAYNKLVNVTERFLDDVALQYLGAVPYDEMVRKAIQRQKPVYEAYPRSKASQAFRAITQKVDAWPLAATPKGHLEFFVDRLIG